MKATELAEKLLMAVAEFGDGPVTLPDPLENWRYPVHSVEFDSGTQSYRIDPDD